MKQEAAVTAGIAVVLAAIAIIPAAGDHGMQLLRGDGASVLASSHISHHGATLYVGGSGPGNYTSIKAAVDDARDGDTVFVYSGVYNESIPVDRQIDILGADTDTTIINAAAGYAVNITAEGAKIQGFTIQNGGYPYAGVILHGAARNTLSRCHFRNNEDAIGIYSSDANTVSACTFEDNTVAVDLHHAAGTVISHCDIADNNGGIYLTEADDTTISRCDIRDNPWVGISLEASSSTTVAGNTFVDDSIRIRGEHPPHFVHDMDGNTVNGLPLLYRKNEDNVTVEDMQLGEVILVNCTEPELHNVTVTDSETGVTAAYCQDAVISGCVFSHNDEGISLSFSSSAALSNNTISASRESGISLRRCDNISITSNHISHTGGHGLYLRASCHNNISMNEVHDNGEGILLHSYSDYNTVYGNDVADSTRYGISIQGGCYNEVTCNVVHGSREWCGICTAKGWTRGNVISNNEVTSNHWVGIEIEGIENTVSRNNISHNTRFGIYLSSFLGTDCRRNTIQANNFIANGQPAYFEVPLLSLNLWSHNYWSSWASPMPKPIHGKCRIPLTPWLGIRVPWCNVDWHPAREPIEGLTP